MNCTPHTSTRMTTGHRLPFRKALLAAVVVTSISFAYSARSDSTEDSKKPTTAVPRGIVERLATLEKRIDELESDFGIGTVVFCSNNSPPGKNWVPCDGKSAFPNDSPVHFRGKMVPNLHQALVAVGDWEQKRVEGTLATQPVNGTKFTLPGPKVKRIGEGKGNAIIPDYVGGWVLWFEANGDYTRVQNGFPNAIGSYGGKFWYEAANYLHHPEGTAVVGNVDVAPPPHAYLQAYVRIR